MSELESLESVRTVRMYLEAHRNELANWTLEPHKHRLQAFVEWYEESGVDDLTELDGRGLYEFRVWRREGNFGVGDDKMPEEVALATLKS